MMSEFQLDGCVRAPDLPLFAANIQIVITCRLTSRRSGVLISPALIRLIRGAARTGLKCCWLWLSSEPADCHQLQTSHADNLHKLKSCTNRKQVYRRRYESRRSSKPKLHLKIRKKLNMVKNDFQYGGWNYYTLQCGMWLCNHYSEFTKWQHPAM